MVRLLEEGAYPEGGRSGPGARRVPGEPVLEAERGDAVLGERVHRSLRGEEEGSGEPVLPTRNPAKELGVADGLPQGGRPRGDPEAARSGQVGDPEPGRQGDRPLVLEPTRETQCKQEVEILRSAPVAGAGGQAAERRAFHCVPLRTSSWRANWRTEAT